MTPAEQKALEKAKDRIQSVREAKLPVQISYWRAIKALEKINKKKAGADALTGKVNALRELAEVLDHSGETGKAIECRQKADALNRELGENRRSGVSIASPSLTGPMISREELETKAARTVSLTASATCATNICFNPQSTPPPTPQTIMSISAATSIQQSIAFFTKDVNPVPIQCSLPGPDEQLQSTYQLVYGLQLLQDSVHEEDLSPEDLQWRHSTRNNLDEKDRLQTIAVQIVQTFRSNATKDAAAVAEVVQLAPVLDNEYSRLLLTSFTDTICQSQHLHVHLVGGLVNVIQGAAPGSISSNDLVVVLQSLFRKLQSTHPESTRDRHHLLLAISQVLDTMADSDIGSLDRDALHGPLKDLLRELESSDDPYLTFQAEYAAQALLNIPDDESVLKAGFRRVWSGLKVVAGFANIMDPTSIKDSLEALENLYESGKGGARLLKDLRSAIRNNDHPTFSMKEGLKFKKAWYDALRRAEMCIKAGGHVEFKNLVTTASYRHRQEFQWGICQLLGRFAADTHWELEARKEATIFLGELYRDSELWNRQEGVDQVIFDALTNVTTNDGASFEGTKSLLEEIRKKSPELAPMVDLQSPFWINFRPSDSSGYTAAKFTLLKTVQIQYPWKPRLYGIHKALNAYHVPELVIRRVSGDTLDLETCFVNLAIVEASAHRQKEKEDLKEQAAVFHRLQSFERVEDTNTGSLIPLEQLFNKRKLPKRQSNEGEDIPRRILVQGRAGIGKTTLCKKLVHAHQNGLWRDMFDVILWIPLRNLRGFTGTTLESLFRNKVFVGEDHDQRQAALSEALATCAKEGKVLFILDGMDEIVADTESEERQTFRRFLMTLLGQQYVVVTSRPSGVDSSLLQSTDLELETVGFSQQNVQDFLVKVLDPEGAASVQEFIRRTPLIQGLVNIPVQLDVICFSWDSLPKDVSHITMTGLYHLMVQRLCRKDAVRLKKKAGKILLTDQRLRSYGPEEMENVMATELLHLGYLAFKGMENRHQIEFEEKDLRQAFRELQESSALNQTLSPEDLVEIVKQTSFLHTADVDLSSKNVNSPQSWHFLHLTFQEYFAATWIVRHFRLKQECLPSKMMSKDQLAEFIYQHKYNPQYEIVWSMVAGLLEGEALAEFFGILKDEPRDLIGGRHQLILASCFNEARGRLDSKYTEEVDEELRKWLRFEMQILQHDDYSVSTLGSQLTFPEATLIETLRAESSWRCTLARTLGARSIMSDAAINFLVNALNDSDKGMKSSVAAALEKQGELPGSAISPLIAALKDEDEDVRCEAATALGRQSKLPESAIHALVAALDDENEDVRYSAATALENNSVLPESAIQALIAALKDKSCIVRLSAVKALGNQNAIPELAFPPVISSLKDQDYHVRSTAESVLLKHFINCEASIQRLITVVEAKDEDTYSSATFALDSCQSTMSTPIQLPTALLKDEHGVKSVVTSIVGKKSGLPESSVGPLVNALKDGHGQVRYEAAEALCNQSNWPESVVGPIVDALKDGDKDVRYLAASLLGNQSELPESAIGSLADALKDADEHVRRAAARSLGNQSELPESAVGSLVDALEDGDEVSYEAGQALCKRSVLPESAVGSLVDALKYGNWNVRSWAACILCKPSELPESAVGSLVDALKDGDWNIREAAVAVLGKQSESESAIGSLVDALKDGCEYVRDAAAKALCRKSELTESVVGSLVDALKNGDKDARDSAVSVLYNRHNLPESGVISLVDALKDGDKDVRDAAAKALHFQSELPESAVGSLVDALKDGDKYARSLAAGVLGDQSELPESAIGSLADALKDGDKDVRCAAARALGNQSELPKSAVGSLVDALRDGNENVRRAAARALRNQSALPESAIGSLTDALKDGDVYVRCAAATALRSQSELPESAIGSLVDALRGEDGGVSVLPKQYGLSKYSLQPLLDLFLQDKGVRSEAARALGNQSELPESAVGSLVDALRDGNENVRLAAADALGKQSELPESAVVSLVDVLKDGDKSVRAAAARALGNQSELPESAVGSLVDALEDGNNQVRHAAASLLRDQSPLPESAIGSLVDALKDGDKDVRSAAARALGNQSGLPESAVHSLIAVVTDGRQGYRQDALQILRDHCHSLCIALPQLSKDEITSVYKSCLFQYSCRRVLSLQLQDSRLRVYTEKGEISEAIGSDVQEKILSAIRAVQDKQGL
ncbi:bilin biosynthesis protein [Entomortierella parvispora]|uniref:Bilin biosynthesis protein n=1 Tax=Entomortierella parvispora TaxID=205924 RepID=A0A9P3HIZ7_9FUNG|nr:bilin biosynthesis protein [Entomortierella parvispora]